MNTTTREIPKVRVHIEGTPDVPDIIHPGDWITMDEGDSFVMVVKVTKHAEGKWDWCPGVESWTIHYLGIGYMDGGAVGESDCGFINGIVAVDGKLLKLYELGWNDEEVKIASKPDYVTVSKSAMALIARSAQMTFL